MNERRRKVKRIGEGSRERKKAALIYRYKVDNQIA